MTTAAIITLTVLGLVIATIAVTTYAVCYALTQFARGDW